MIAKVKRRGRGEGKRGGGVYLFDAVGKTSWILRIRRDKAYFLNVTILNGREAKV